MTQYQTEQLLKQLSALLSQCEATPTTEKGIQFLEFSEKEISKMPKQFRKLFRAQGCVAHVRKRTTGRYNCSYEIRYAKKPYNNPPISASGSTLEEAKTNFIEKLNNYAPQNENAFTVPKDFHGFAMYWFENFHKRKVAEKTYKKNLATYNRDIQKKFANMKLSEVSPVHVQKLLDSYSHKGRTAETLHSLFNQIFVCAVKHGIIKNNPLNMCFYKKHKREHGNALTKEEEKKLLTEYKETPFLIDFAIALFTGLRPNEYATAQINGNFIIARNSKRKDNEEETKRIPITPMLKPFIENTESLHMHRPAAIAKRLKALFPNHILYDLRTTFQTRCTECGIAEVAIGLFMGNAIGCELKKAYTDVSEEWLLKEGEKLNY